MKLQISQEIPPGTYVVAVSGGVDSMVLLDLLTKMPHLHLIVAHFDHGIRSDSIEDRKLAQTAAQKYHIPYMFAAGKLGPDASEADARDARYDFLRGVQKMQQAKAIIVAHHEDDVLETMLLNMLRGTNRSGLSSLQSHKHTVRPLLDVPKKDIIAYAKAHDIQWREDSTNKDLRYKRNQVRHHMMPKLSQEQRRELGDIYKRASVHNALINREVSDILDKISTDEGIKRHELIMLPHAISREVMLMWLRQHGAQDIDKKQVERLVTAAKTARVSTTHDVDKRKIMNIGRNFIEITSRQHS